MNEYLHCAMDIGEQMLICGAEVHRVEDSVKRMGSAFGAGRTDVFIITSSMVVTMYKDGDSFTETRRIGACGTDIERLHRLNDLSRRICRDKLPVSRIAEEYEAILQTPVYPFPLEAAAYAVIAGSFTLFFGGGWIEALVSLVIGMLLRFVILFADRTVMNRIFGKLIASFAASALAFTSVGLTLISTADKVIIGNIMLLIPGIGLTNALRDLFVGDSIAGVLRMIDAALTALAIAAGYFLCSGTLGGLLS